MTRFRIPCGDWVYPSKDSTAGVQYPIEVPLVAEIFLTAAQAEMQISNRKDVGYHLTGPRYLEVDLEEDQNTLWLLSLKNNKEEDFEKDLSVDITYELETLPRVTQLPDPANSDECGIFFASVILMAHLEDRALPSGITFRPLTIPEIEALGRW